MKCEYCGKEFKFQQVAEDEDLVVFCNQYCFQMEAMKIA